MLTNHALHPSEGKAAVNVTAAQPPTKAEIEAINKERIQRLINGQTIFEQVSENEKIFKFQDKQHFNWNKHPIVTDGQFLYVHEAWFSIVFKDTLFPQLINLSRGIHAPCKFWCLQYA